MSVFKVASRYAKSLIDLAKEQGSLDAIKTDIEQFIAVLKANPELRAVLSNPIIKLDQKVNILEALFKDKINPSILSFFKIMINKGRAEVIEAASHEFIREYNEVKGIVKATVTSAAPLSDANLSEIKTTIANQINAEVVITNKVDQSLIAGFVITIGDKQFDASVAGKLNRLERYFDGQRV